MAPMNQALPLSSSSPAETRLQALRAEMVRAGVEAYLVPMADAYQSEYVAPPDRRIGFLTGFTGSSAFVIVLADRAVFFTDSRYTLQSQEQVDAALYEILDTAQKLPSDWLAENLRPKMRVGFDPALHTQAQIERLEASALKQNASLTPVEGNLVDLIWPDRPSLAPKPAVAHDVSYAGKSSALKRQELAAALAQKNVNAAVIADPASIAWLLNIRGDDLPMTPVALSALILKADGTAEWFLDPRKASGALAAHLGSEVIRYDEADFAAALRRLGEARSRVLVDPAGLSYRFFAILRESGATLEKGSDPCALPRACKNTTEIEGMRAAHRRDGAALVKLLAWLDRNAARRPTELEIEAQLEAFRAEGTFYKGTSFETIAGAGPNGAIVHYRATQETDAPLRENSFLLLDSGGHYLDGTTDVTRTIPVGAITNEMKDRYTRVLKGMIALSCIRFPEGASGADLDVLARQYLWAEGLDYGHGTGHGVGSYLCVHEGPQSISHRGNVPLKIGMVLSNEPGFYKPRHYGIRLENMMYVTELFEITGPERKMLGFETLTLAPFDNKAIALDLLTKAEKDWINAYHKRVFKALRPQLDEATGAWLAGATAEI